MEGYRSDAENDCKVDRRPLVVEQKGVKKRKKNLKEVSHIYLTEFSLLLNYLSREERQRKEEGQR